MADPRSDVPVTRSQKGQAQGGPSLHRVITSHHAVAIYVSSVLGAGIFVVPGLAARIAGPASILSVALLPFITALLLVSVAIAGLGLLFSWAVSVRRKGPASP